MSRSFLEGNTCTSCNGASGRPYKAKGLCERCYAREWRAAHPGYMTEAVRVYRSDPEKRERDREASRRWKRENLGAPGLPKGANAA